MNERFAALVDTLEGSLQKLTSMEPAQMTALPRDMPASGVYVLYEHGKALYVGRSNRMRARLMEHGRPSAGHNTAPFAFRLARIETGRTEASYTAEGSRAELEQDPDFKAAFTEQKARVRRMQVRYVKETDPLRQALLEIYVAVALDTKYNKFDTT